MELFGFTILNIFYSKRQLQANHRSFFLSAIIIVASVRHELLGYKFIKVTEQDSLC
jgi:hypothetical protein